ncbi:carbonic anhydrase 13 [Bacillus rossius redtenbacheri]|uniref:carbonic anhydrase 13 n=1 Tax=Bacillus rossius redtenbacheri TaxID=93214 RepID=UPI002FDF0037
MNLDWGYAEENGPDTWASKFPQAAGSRQSPVDIVTTRVSTDKTLRARPLSWRYVPDNCRQLSNTGHGWKVDVLGYGSELTGGPLTEKHTLEQFHAHWGVDSSQGSEHTVDGRAFAGELHFVHWNSLKYKTFADAASQPDGLAVLAVLLQVGETHSELQKLVDLIPEVIYKGQKVAINSPIDPAKFFADCHGYWTYQGSLTTPPCNESVTWIVFKTPIQVSEEQLSVFRTLRCYEEHEECPCNELQGLLVKNFRPPLHLGNRELRECASA